MTNYELFYKIKKWDEENFNFLVGVNNQRQRLKDILLDRTLTPSEIYNFIDGDTADEKVNTIISFWRNIVSVRLFTSDDFNILINKVVKRDGRNFTITAIGHNGVYLGPNGKFKSFATLYSKYTFVDGSKCAKV